MVAQLALGPATTETPFHQPKSRGAVAAEPMPAPDWAAVRAEYEAGGAAGTLPEIAARHGIAPTALRARAAAEQWTRRSRTRRVNRRSIITRLFRLLDGQIAQLESQMTKTGEKEVAVLGKLASTLEKLIEIDNAEPRRAEPRVESEEMKELRHRLAQRIAQLKRS
jgi:hypothetical protein